MGPKHTSGRPQMGGGNISHRGSHHSSRHNSKGGPSTDASAGQSAPKEPINSLDLSSFLSSLEQEVGHLHSAIKTSRDARVEKAFQRVPRSMRRRTASHNARRLPRRLRRQAHRDQAADNTPSMAIGLAKRKKARPASAWVYENTKKRIKLQEEKKLAAQGLDGGEDNGDRMDVDDSEFEDVEGDDDDNDDNDVEGGASLRAPRAPLPIKNLRLPTHRWHAKRAQMENPGFLWNTTIVRTPANKTYRMTLRASGLRSTMCVSWDTSYKATIYLKGPEKKLDETLRAVVEPHLLTAALKKGACCVDAKLPQSFGYQHHQPDNSASASAFGEFGGPGNCGALALFYNPIPTPQTDDTVREAFVRVHPTIFSNVWTALNLEIVHKQLPVIIRDFRLEIGSIDVSGSAAVDALAATLYPYETSASPMEPLGREFLKLRKMDTGGLSPASGAMLAFNIQDPRLDEPDNTDDKSGCGTARIGRASALQAWPETDARRPSGLFNTQTRHSATKLPPLQVIDKRRGKLGAGEKLLVQHTSRPIPVIFAAGESSSVPTDANPHAGNRNSTASSTWTLIAPRACIDAIWMRLHVHTLPSGHRPMIGGLEEEQHMALERGRPWFPADFPGTPTGWDWELQARLAEEKEWNRKPTAKRTQWATVDLRNGTKGELGSGVACDWEYLFGVDAIAASRTTADTDTDTDTGDGAGAGASKTPNAEAAGAKRSADGDIEMGVCTGDDDTNKSAGLEEAVQFAALRPGEETSELVRDMQHASWADIRTAVKNTRLQQPVIWRTPYQLMTISVHLLQGGTPGARSRIYRLPGGDLRAQWLALAGSSTLGADNKQQQQKRMPAAADLDTRKRLLAQSLLETSLPYPRPAATGLYGTHHLALPGREDLVGFVTSGAQRFQSGRGFGIGHVGAQKLVESILAADTEAERKPGIQQNQVPIHRDARLCIVRNVGEEVGHLARWTPISN